MKSDQPARSASKRDYWKHIINEWEGSECATQAAFCRHAGVSIKSFSRWRSVFAREQLQRQSINGLSVLVANNLELSPLSGSLFVFYNKARDKIKILYWDRNGFCLWYKRLEKHRFHIPAHISETGGKSGAFYCPTGVGKRLAQGDDRPVSEP